MRIGEWFRGLIGAPQLPAIECSLTNCSRRTKKPFDSNPRKRWIVGAHFKDEDGSEIILNFCPNHVRTYFEKADEEFFLSLERTEKLIAETRASR